MKIILAPYSVKLPNQDYNPKNPPFDYWPKVVTKLNELGYEVIQIGGLNEEKVEGVAQVFTNYPFPALKTILEDADGFVSVDSFLPHFVWSYKIKKRGVVIFSQSDPLIFGHEDNINLLKDRKFLRELQFQTWMGVPYNEEAFVTPDEVVNAVSQIARS